MERSLSLYLTLSLFVGSLASCSFYHEKAPKDLSLPNIDGSQPKIAYQTVRQKVFLPNCVLCHGNSGGVNLESYSSIKANLSRIKKAVLVEKTMPKGRLLGEAEFKILEVWINEGAPEEGDVPDSSLPNGAGPLPSPIPPVPAPSETPLSIPPIESIELSFVSIKKRIFDIKCILCHSDGGVAAAISLKSLQDLLKSSKRLVVPKSPDESGLWIAVNSEDSKKMPPPNSGVALTPEEKAAIKKWIEMGAPETSGGPPSEGNPAGGQLVQPSPSGPQDGDATQLSYALVRQKIFMPRCVACHGNSGGISLESYSSVKNNLARISVAALLEKSMPKGSSLTQEESSLLLRWIKAGAAEGASVTPSPPPLLPVYPPGDDSSQVTYAVVREKIFVPRCVACHGNSGGIKLESYSSIKNNLGRIAIAALMEKSMPKGSSLPQEESSLLLRWIKAGAPEGVPVTPPSPLPSPVVEEPLIPTFVSIKKKIFDVRCLSCHSGTSPRGDLSFESLKDVMKSSREPLKMEDDGDPDSSGLGIVISRKDAKRMPPPSTGAPLSDSEIDVIKKWIKAGAPEGIPGTPPQVVEEPLVPTFTSIKKKVFDVRCLSCHSGPSPRGDLSFESLKDVMKSSREPLKMEDDGDPDSSGLGIAIGRKDAKRMPPPSTGSALSDAEIDIIKKWIKNGAKE